MLIQLYIQYLTSAEIKTNLNRLKFSFGVSAVSTHTFPPKIFTQTSSCQILLWQMCALLVHVFGKFGALGGLFTGLSRKQCLMVWCALLGRNAQTMKKKSEGETKKFLPALFIAVLPNICSACIQKPLIKLQPSYSVWCDVILTAVYHTFLGVCVFLIMSKVRLKERQKAKA